jgi:hypothetical protein
MASGAPLYCMYSAHESPTLFPSGRQQLGMRCCCMLVERDMDADDQSAVTDAHLD